MKQNLTIDEFIEFSPFGFSQEQKAEMFDQVMRQAFEHHMRNNPIFERYCQRSGFSLAEKNLDLSRYPFLPASFFKTNSLMSVPQEKIKMRLESSATSGIPSSIFIDDVTARRQTKTSARIIADYIGSHRRPFLFLDQDPVLSKAQEISARSAATRGFLPFASSAEYFLKDKDGQLEIDLEKLQKKLKRYEGEKKEACLLGFTYILYASVVRPMKEKGVSFQLPKPSMIIHIGGWKKLKDESVTPELFLEDVRNVFGLENRDILDFYGFTEQMGLVYGNRGAEAKTVPLYSQMIVRDIHTLRPAADGQDGLVQILAPIPHSYPGISVLTEDVGHTTGGKRDKEGRWGTQFVLTGRAEQAELRGCGDVLAELLE
jgi:hypothetical protein